MLNTTGMGGKAKQKKTTLFTSTEPLEHMLPFSLTGAHAISLLSHHHPQGKASFFSPQQEATLQKGLSASERSYSGSDNFVKLYTM